MSEEVNSTLGGPNDGAGLIIERVYYDEKSYLKAIKACEVLDLNYEVVRNLETVNTMLGFAVRRTYSITILAKEVI
jgi:hypothetical protein